MISDAINDSDRLSSCNKQVRKKIAPDAGVFQVFSVVLEEEWQERSRERRAATEEMRLNYNVGGICLSEPAFNKLRQEISLAAMGGRMALSLDSADAGWTSSASSSSVPCPSRMECFVKLSSARIASRRWMFAIYRSPMDRPILL